MPGPVTSTYWTRLLGAPYGCIGPSDQKACACRPFGATGARGLRSALLRQEHRPPVLAPARLVLLRAERALLAVGDHRHPVGGNAARGEVVHGALGPTVAEGQVVFGGSPLVTMALDQDQLIGVLAE